MHRQLGPQPKTLPNQKTLFPSSTTVPFSPLKPLLVPWHLVSLFIFTGKTKNKNPQFFSLNEFFCCETNQTFENLCSYVAQFLVRFVCSRSLSICICFYAFHIYKNHTLSSVQISLYINVFRHLGFSGLSSETIIYLLFKHGYSFFSRLHCLVVCFVKINFVLEVDIVEGLVQNIIFQHEQIFFLFFFFSWLEVRNSYLLIIQRGQSFFHGQICLAVILILVGLVQNIENRRPNSLFLKAIKSLESNKITNNKQTSTHKVYNGSLLCFI